MIPDHFQFQLPGWINKILEQKPDNFPTLEDRMHLAIDLAHENIQRKTGGPFGAAIFERETGKLISVGINLVTTGTCSILHAEVVAMMLAQKQLGKYCLNASDLPKFDLVTSVEPCAMCLGAVPWAGVHCIICGARQEDAEAIGFDEGAKPDRWIEELKKRNIEVVQDVLRDKAVDVLNKYKTEGGIIY